MKKIDYIFKVDGFYDSVNYYRSESPMQTDAMPAPTATGITELTYSDETAEDNALYYVRLSSIKNNVEKISNEVKVIQQDATRFVLLPLQTDLEDIGAVAKTWASNGGASALTGALVLNGTNQYLSCTNSQFNFGTADFIIDFYVKPENESGLYGCILANGQTTSTNMSTVMIRQNLSFQVRCNQTVVINTTAALFTAGQWSRVTITRTGTIFKLYINNVYVSSAAYTASSNEYNLALNGITYIGRNNWDGANGYFKGEIKHLRIHKGTSDLSRLYNFV